jgi:hypothetical protein
MPAPENNLKSKNIFPSNYEFDDDELNLIDVIFKNSLHTVERTAISQHKLPLNYLMYNEKLS